MPTASIIVPIYNVAPFLPQCLNSLCAVPRQDIEVLLIDDGATDDSPGIARDYVARDPRFRLVRRPNGGLSAARNTGLDEARGEYIFFLDGDDWIDPALIGDALAVAEAGADQVVWNYCYARDGQIGPPKLPMREETLDLSPERLPAYFYRYWFPYKHGQEAWARLYRRDLLQRHDLRFVDGQAVFAEDTLMTATLLLYTPRLAVLEKPYVYYRQRSGSIMEAPKPRLAQRLMELCVRYVDEVERAGRMREMRHVLPMFTYRLVTKGIGQDPDPAQVLAAMAAYRERPEMQAQLRALRDSLALPAYLLHTGTGFRTQWRGRAFAARWLQGDFAAAARLVEGWRG